MFHSIRLELLFLLISLFPCFVISLFLWPHDLYCDYVECCKSPWVKPDFVLLAKNLSHDFYGQHLVAKSAFKMIKRHVEIANPQKPLILSFHGLPGTGKTFFSKLLAASFYKYGTKSRHVKFFQKPDFFLEAVNKDFVEHAKSFIKVIETKLSRCGNSLFIIDDANLMNPKLYDVLLPYVNYRPDIYEDVSYNKAIFIFISNTGGKAISDYLLKQLKAGRKREWITSEEMHTVLHDEVLKYPPFKDSAFVKREVVDAFIPFFPLEKEHVRECVYAILRERNILANKEKVNEIVDSLTYFPDKENMFSVGGCKRLHNVVDDSM